jgi:hypothetical protein
VCVCVCACVCVCNGLSTHSEQSPCMHAVAGATLKANGYGGDRVVALCTISTAMRVPAHMPTRAAILVSEVVDSGLLGEGAVVTLRHALQHLVVPRGPAGTGAAAGGPDPVCVPAGASVFVALVECDAVRVRASAGVAAGAGLLSHREPYTWCVRVLLCAVEVDGAVELLA